MLTSAHVVTEPLHSRQCSQSNLMSSTVTGHLEFWENSSGPQSSSQIGPFVSVARHAATSLPSVEGFTWKQVNSEAVRNP